MELLLILSALLSAATGAFTGARAPDAAPRHEAAAEAVARAEAIVAVAGPVEPDEGDRPSGSATGFASAADAPLPGSATVESDRLIE